LRIAGQTHMKPSKESLANGKPLSMGQTCGGHDPKKEVIPERWASTTKRHTKKKTKESGVEPYQCGSRVGQRALGWGLGEFPGKTIVYEGTLKKEEGSGGKHTATGAW